MLAFLQVKGFAIIDRLEVEFKDGFNVITGETGAGKSILINALSTLLTAKTPSDVIRVNADHAEVVGHCFRGADEYIIRRLIGNQGRSRAFLNDSPVTLKKLEELGEELISIYGQHESQYLLNKDAYVAIIDHLLSLEADRKLLSERVRELKETAAELERKKNEAEGQAREASLLQYQIEEIERADLKEGEEESIRERLRVLKDAEKIQKCLNTIHEGLYEGDTSVHASLAAFGALLRPFNAIEEIEGLRKRFESVSFDLEEIFGRIRDFEKSLVYDEDEAARLEERLSLIFKLKDKYGKTCQDVKAFEERARGRLGYLTNLTVDISDLDRKKSALDAEVGQLAEKLSRERKKGAASIEKAIVDELHFLSMKGTRFTIEFIDKGAIDEEGKDDVELLLSTNPGEPMRPLRKVASGGELSRIMLAMKRVIGGEEGKTLIFDEIDAGIGGRVAEMVGKRLQELARAHQVICITHLPQIAVHGTHHFLVEKEQSAESTRTAIRELSEKERVREVARMLGGLFITEKTLQRAEEMLKDAQKSTN